LFVPVSTGTRYRREIAYLSDRPRPPPRSNRLSDAPSAALAPSDREAPLFHELVTPADLSAVFQPIVSLAGGSLFAYEALVRCRVAHLPPTALFERAAALRSAGRLGRMMREIAVPLCNGIPLFVNVHPTELEQGWLQRADDPIFSHDDDIYLEVTESAPTTHFDLCVKVLREVCKRAGVHLVVDDLGAGSSNLNVIADLEPKVVKLDRRLVQDLDSRPRQRKVVSMVVRLCEELEAVVVAEGIETVEELSAVRDAGAQYGQGYLLGRPSFPAPHVTWPPPPSRSELPTLPEGRMPRS
jgi:EAL domain-containing protein (putative c-di-GMP-specific phosphodiesterase class I)